MTGFSRRINCHKPRSYFSLINLPNHILVKVFMNNPTVSTALEHLARIFRLNPSSVIEAMALEVKPF